MRVTPPMSFSPHQSSSAIFPGSTPQLLKVLPDTEGHDKERDLLLHEPNGLFVQMVIVVVGDHHGVDGGQLIERKWRFVEALRTNPADGRDSITPNGIREHPLSVELDEHCGVAQPSPQPGRRRPREVFSGGE